MRCRCQPLTRNSSPLRRATRRKRAPLKHRARAERPAGSERRLVAAEIMAAIYRAILDRIEARHYDVFSSTVRVPRPRRAAIAATTWMRVLAGRA